MNKNYIEINQAAIISVGGPVYNLSAAAIQVPEVDGPIFLRPCTSDIPVFQAIFQQMEYETSLISSQAEIIVDLGANTGISSIFFHEKYKKARVFAVEPSISNFDMLTLNTVFRPRITACKAAAWGHDDIIYLDLLSEGGVDLGHWAHRTTTAPAAGGEKVEALSMDTIMQRYGIHEIDLLKIDVEGAEFEIFSSKNLDWINRVKTIVVETHERFRPGVDAIIANVMKEKFIEHQPNGENRIFTRIGSSSKI